MSINRFPYQDDILRILEGSDGSASVAQVAAAVAAEGRHTAEGHDSPALHAAIAENIAHLVHLGLAEYTGGSGDDRAAKLTAVGQEAAGSLP